MKDARPLIVMGMGRSGTRFFSDILSSHESILLYGEIPHPSMAKLFNLLDSLDKEHGSNEQRLKRWNQKKFFFVKESFKSMAMGNAKDNKKALFFGHKTPRSERFFDLYEKHFSSVNKSAFYFYCLRNPLDVWASYKNMPWNSFSNVEVFVSNYLDSYRRYERAKLRSRGRVFLLNLEEYKMSEDPGRFIRDKVFSPIGLSVSNEFSTSLTGKKNVNSSRLYTGREPEKLLEGDSLYILNDKGMRKIIDENFSWVFPS